MMLKVTSVLAAGLCVSIVSSTLAQDCSEGCWDCNGIPTAIFEDADDCWWFGDLNLEPPNPYGSLFGGRTVVTFTNGGALSVRLLSSESIAWAVVNDTYYDSVFDYMYHVSERDFQFGPSIARACGVPQYYGACGYARVTDGYTLTSTGATIYADPDYPHPPYYFNSIGTGFAAARATMLVEPVALSASQGVAQQSLGEPTITQHASFILPVPLPRPGINRSVVVLGDSIAASLITTDVYTKATNLNFETGTPDHWAGSTESQLAAGEHELAVLTQSFTDKSFDVDGDGRFNILDQNELVTLLGPTTSETVRWDFDNDDFIDQDDVDVLARLIGHELDSGIFGDLNRDGVVDCTDRYVIAEYPDATLEDAGYHIELDFDLDGDNDSGDRSQFLSVLCPEMLGDMNCDRSVDAFDIDAFTIALVRPAEYEAMYPHCNRHLVGDINGDGLFDAFDIDPFAACVVTGSCP